MSSASTSPESSCRDSGIFGLAVAFAAQDTMENVIAGIFIIVDRPFREGERITAAQETREESTAVGEMSRRSACAPPTSALPTG